MIKFEVHYSPETNAVLINPISGKQDPSTHFDAVVNLNYALNRFFLAVDPEFHKTLKSRTQNIIMPQVQEFITNPHSTPLTFPYSDPSKVSIE